MNLKKLSIIFGLLAVFLVVVIFARSSQNLINTNNSKEEISIVSQDGNKITISTGGKATLKSNSETFSENWDINKLKALQSYLQKNYLSFETAEEGSLGSVTFYQNGGKITVSVDSELVNEITKDIQQGDDYGNNNGEETGGEDVSNFFTSPTPTSTSQTASPTSTPPSGGAGGDPECIYWRLSYCVVKRTPPPTQTPIPGQETVELPPTCADPGNRETGRTVIGNELCLPEE